MKTFKLNLSDLQLNREEIFLNLGYGGKTPDEQILAMIEHLIATANDFCRPEAGYRIYSGKLTSKDTLEINQIPMIVGSIIAKYYAQATHFATFVATAGIEFDNYLQQLKAEGDFLNEFLADALGSEIVEATLRYVTDRINEEAKLLGFSTTPAYGPGHCTWQVNEQKTLFSLLPENPCRITLNASSLMSPIKSVSGVIGLGIKIKQKPYACAICRLRNCHKRKVPRLL